MPNLVDWNKCCGCGACANKCPKNAIRMLPNQEGFLHPEIDSSLCVECGACETVCPGLSPATKLNNNPEAFIAQHKDDDIRYQSTSGGAFTAIAAEVIRRGGVVFGAVMTEDLTVRHECVDSIERLARFRNSKYLQSEIGDCFKESKSRLISGQWVCFSGTPCQINGLYKYLEKDYDNLIAIDVVCKSVPSPLVFKKYVEYKKAKEGDVTDVVFRDKKRGFLYCTMAHYQSHENRLLGKDCYRRGSESDEWLRLFLSGKISRRSCTTCPFQGSDKVSDFTLGDIWETGHAEFDDNKGTTLVHVWTEKGIKFLDSLKDDIKIEEYPQGIDRGLNRKRNPELLKKRKQLFVDANNLSDQEFFAKYAPYSFMVKMKEVSRFLIWKAGLHNLVRHIKHVLIH